MKNFVEKLTVEELSLISLYDTSSRESLLNDLVAAQQDTRDSDMIEVFEKAIESVETISESELESIKKFIANGIF